MSSPKRLVQNKRLIILVIAMIAITFTAFTTAWLNDTASTKTNVFVSGKNLTISFDETTGDGERIVPGDKVAKDPTVTVGAGSEPCYLFVKAKGNANAADYLDYSFDSGWSPYSEFIVDGALDPTYQTNNTFYFDSTSNDNDNVKAYLSNGGTDLFTGTKDTNIKMWVAYDNASVYVYFKMYTPHLSSSVRMYYDPDPTASNDLDLTSAIASTDHGDVAFRVDYYGLNVVGECSGYSSDKAPYYNSNYFKDRANLLPFEFSDSTGSGYGFEVRFPRKDDGSNTFRLNFAAENNVNDNDKTFAWSFGPEWWIQHSSMRTFDFNNNFVSQNYDGYYYRIVGDVEDGVLTEDQTFHILEGLSTTDRNGNSMANGFVEFRSKKQNGTDIVLSDVTNPDVTLSFKAVAIQQQNLVLSEAFRAAKPQLDS